jgi:hypothetical protein
VPRLVVSTVLDIIHMVYLSVQPSVRSEVSEVRLRAPRKPSSRVQMASGLPGLVIAKVAGWVSIKAA